MNHSWARPGGAPRVPLAVTAAGSIAGWAGRPQRRFSLRRCVVVVSNRLVCAVLAAALVSGVEAESSARTAPDADQAVEGEQTLESRLLAPCCWTQTLDVHESEIAHSLRAEIRSRLAAGQSPDSIEADLISRYGERIRAFPKGTSLTRMGMWVSLCVAAAGLGVALAIGRWVRRGRREAARASGPDSSNHAPIPGRIDSWDERLDAEIDDLSD
jgi:cytochrome c-type biogenesis protein CcmH